MNPGDRVKLTPAAIANHVWPILGLRYAKSDPETIRGTIIRDRGETLMIAWDHYKTHERVHKKWIEVVQEPSDERQDQDND